VGQLISKKDIIAIGGGKGGVGKSFLASNLGVILAKNNNKAVLIDADLGGANLHTCLGIPSPSATLSDFISDPSVHLNDIMVRTAEEHLTLISGAQDFLGIANPKYTQKIKLLRAIQAMDANYIILDLGAGTSLNTLDFFLIADKGVLVVIPEPTSIENAYRFIKSALYRKLKLLSGNSQVKEVIKKAMNKKNDLGIGTPIELIEYVRQMDDKVGTQLSEAVSKFRPRIVLNQVRTVQDVRMGFAMQNACQKYFGIQVDFLGYLENDEQIWQSIRKRQPITLNGNYSKSARSLRTIAYNLLNDLQIRPE
jgi:flagellar biosynthesis protein FlhG